MSTPGWYPDPGGEPGRFRFWSGTEWGHDTSDTPGPPPSPSPPRGPWRWLGPLLGGVLVVGIAIALVLVFVAPRNDTNDTADGGSDTSTSEASATSSAWDETSTPSASAAKPANCDVNTPNELPTPSLTGMLTVGHLSLSGAPEDWAGPRADSRVPYGRDVYGYSQTITSETKKGWASVMTIGVVTFPKGTAKEAMVSTMTQCIVTSAFYTSVDVKVAQYSQKAITVTGHGAVQADVLLTFNDPDLTTKGSSLRVIAIDTSGDTQFFFSAVPMENTAHQELVNLAINALVAS